jgi:hypothetical protein
LNHTPLPHVNSLSSKLIDGKVRSLKIDAAANLHTSS